MSGEFKGTPGPWHIMRGDVLDKNGRMVALIEGFVLERLKYTTPN